MHTIKGKLSCLPEGRSAYLKGHSWKTRGKFVKQKSQMISSLPALTPGITGF
jgi:hypothetical protein